MPRKMKDLGIETQSDELFFQKLSGTYQEPTPWPTTDEGELAVDVYETKKEIVVKAAIAGLKAEDLSLSLEDDLLTIKGTRESHEYLDGTYLCKECHWGQFSRSIILPTPVQTQKAKAQLQRGILTITMPKAKKGTKISIQELDD